MQRRSQLVRLALAAALLVASRAWAAPTYNLLDLGTLGGSSSAAWGINEAGQVVGAAATATGAQHAFLYTNGMMIDLGTLGGASSFAYGVNRAGQVVGAAAVGASSTSHAFLYSAGRMTDLGTLGGTSSVAQAINAAGQITGSAQPGGGAPLHAFLYSGGAMTDLGTLGGTASFGYGINGAGDVVGAAYDAAARAHAFLYHGTLADLGTLGGLSSSARGINDAGDVVGVAADASNTQRAFLYRSGVMQDLGALGRTASFAYAINGLGDVVGWVADEDEPARAFLYADGLMTDLNTLIPVESGWTLHEARAINDGRQIAAVGALLSGADHALLLTPLDVPTTTTTTVTTTTTSTTSTTLQCDGGVLGDCNVDGALNLFDVLTTIDVVLGKITPTAVQQCLCDDSCDGAIDIFDVLREIDALLGRIPTPLTCTGAAPAVTVKISRTPAETVSAGHVRVMRQGNAVVLRNRDAAVRGLELTLAPRHSRLEILGVRPTRRTRHFMTAFQQASPTTPAKVLVLSLSGDAIQPGTGPVVLVDTRGGGRVRWTVTQALAAR